MREALGWPSIVRLGLVQAAIGAIVMLATSLLNRVMVVEYALPAVLPAALVAWHYAVQLSRPRWGHASDVGRRRTPWIVIGMGTLAMGSVLATNAALLTAASPAFGIALGVVAYAMIGGGVGAAGTSLLALLATEVAPARRPAAAATTWIMMIAGIVVTAAAASQLIDPFSPARLATVAGGIALAAFVLSLVAVWGVERGTAPAPAAHDPKPAFGEVLREVWEEPLARRFTVFVFVAMLAYSMQDMVLEPFAGLVFAYTPGESTGLASVQHGGVLAGMILVGLAGGGFGGRAGSVSLRPWIVGGCLGSAAALGGLALAAATGPGWPLAPTVFALGFANGVFAVAAIGSMMEHAGRGASRREGIRMGVWGAAQAIAFAVGGVLGAAGVDAGRTLMGSTPPAFLAVFAAEAALFAAAALLAARIGAPATVGIRASAGAVS
jgi:MFS transporter, BCD family, chlorophyll transporter